MKNIRSLALILCTCLASAAWAQQSPSNPLNNWSEFLRTNMHRYNPAETTLSVINVPYLQVKWLYSLGTDTPSSPVVVNGVVYVQTVSGSYGRVNAVKAGTGAQLWSYLEDIDGGSESTPAVADGVVYFGNDYGAVQALDAGTGALLWSSNPVGAYIDHSSPAVSLGMIFVGTDSAVVAVATSDGTEVWSFSTGAEVASSPAVVGMDRALWLEPGEHPERLISFGFVHDKK